MAGALHCAARTHAGRRWIGRMFIRMFILESVAVERPSLLAYHIASLRGLDVDQPRNLAKSVTVE